MTYKELEEYLFSIRDDKFADFSKSLSNSEYISIGVKNPKLKEIIKEHKQDFELNPNDFILGKYLEVDHIYFGLSLIRLNNLIILYEATMVNIKFCILFKPINGIKS